MSSTDALTPDVPDDPSELLEELEQRTAEHNAELRARAERHLVVLNELAHEVRTPLAAAAGLLELVLSGDDELAPRAREDVSLAHASIREALRIVSDQLDRARLETGALPLARSEVDLVAELRAIRHAFRALVGPGVSLVVEPARQPVIVRTDAILLGHVLRNLVGNALKFTDRGVVRLAARPATSGGAEIEVADTGVGIAASDQERIFRPWQQVAAEQPGRTPGSGLGLPLVRELVERLGGAITLSSEATRGSTFTVWLPSVPAAS